MVRNRAGRATCHRGLECPQASVRVGAPTAPSHPASFRYRRSTKCRMHLADAPLMHIAECSQPSPYLVEECATPEQIPNLNLDVAKSVHGRNFEYIMRSCPDNLPGPIAIW